MLISGSKVIRLALWVAFVAVLARVAPASADEFRLIELDGAYLKWGETDFGAPATVTYSFVSARVTIPRARNCSVLAPIEGLARSSGLPVSALKREFAAAAREWEKVANIRFRYVSDPAEAQILVGSQGIPRGRAFANVRYRAQSVDNALSMVSGPDADEYKAYNLRELPIRSLDQALICLDATSAWKIGFDGNLDRYDLRYTFMHEVGHAIGLNHPSPSGSAMSFRYEELSRNLGPGDIAGARLLYGPVDGEDRHP